MLRTELGWTVANPPDTIEIVHSACGPLYDEPEEKSRVRSEPKLISRTEEALAVATLLDDLDQTRLELLDGGHVVGQNTHLSGLGGNVDLDDILGLEDRLRRNS